MATRTGCSSLLQRALSQGETALHEQIIQQSAAESRHARRGRDGVVFGPPAVRVNCLYLTAERLGQENVTQNSTRSGPGALALIFAYYRCVHTPSDRRLR